MKKLLLLSLVAALLILPLLPASVLGEEAEKEEVAVPEGQTAFLKSKCNLCHTVVAVGIGEPREEPEDEDDDVALPPDLSFVGSSREAEWTTLYLQKKETIDGNKHKKRYKGKDEDLAVLVDWLVSLKAPGDTLAVEPDAEVPGDTLAVEPEAEAPEAEAPEAEATPAPTPQEGK